MWQSRFNEAGESSGSSLGAFGLAALMFDSAEQVD